MDTNQHSGTILVVDDERAYRDAVADVLRSQGYTVLKAGSADEALNTVKGEITDIIYLGEITKYYVMIENGQTIFTKHHNRSGIKPFQAGEKVFIGWAISDCRLIQ